MPKGVRLSDDELRQVVDLYRAAGGNAAAVARQLQISVSGTHQRVRAAQQRGFLDETAMAEARGIESFTSGRRLPQTADDCWAVLDQFIGRSPKPPVQQQRTRANAEQQRMVIASDFHAPFQCNRSVAQLIAREATQTDVLVIAGDFTDSYSYSRFVRFEPITAESEWAACDALLGQLSSAFPEIVCIAGNHDMRLERHLRSQLSPDVMFAIEQLTGGVMDPFKAIAKRYPNVRFEGHTVGRHGAGWFTQIGDLLVAHAEKFSRVPGSASRSIEEWFRDNHDTLGLKPWRVLSQAHTHQLSAIYYGSDKLLVESACLCETHGYQLQPKIGGRPQRRGYVTLTQTAGVTDVNSVRLVWLDPILSAVA